MKQVYTFLFFMLIAWGAKAQMSAVVDFETDGDAALWSIFSNGASSTADDMTIVANPSKDNVNMSNNVLQFNVRADADTWAGAYSDSYGPLTFTNDAHILVMMVLKSKISPCCLKVENSSDGGQNKEVKVPNTLTDQWELLSFDMSDAIGHSYGRLTMFPDFPDSRTEGTLVYIDNISAATSTNVKKLHGNQVKTYPNPVINTLYIQHPGMYSISINSPTGQLISSMRFPVSDSKLITMPLMNPGLYVISVESKYGHFSSTILKQ